MKSANNISNLTFLLISNKLKCIFLLVLIITLSNSMSLKDDSKKRKKTTGDNIGTSLYSGQVTTQSMKRPQRWFFNVIMKKPNEKYFREAEYNGLRYQTELLQDSLEREYNNYVKEFYDEKLNVAEQKLIARAKEHKLKEKKQNLN